MILSADDPRASSLVAAIERGELATLTRLLADHPGLARAQVENACGDRRSLLHVVSDWPGHFPGGAATVATLVAAGADPNARFVGRHTETPLHWAASCDDVAVLDALLDAGADMEADGGVIAGGTPLADAVAFGQWTAARRLVERGATMRLHDAAALGVVEAVEERLRREPPPSPRTITQAFWYACHGGRRETAELLLERGADLQWIGWNDETPLDAGIRSGAEHLVEWLRARGARSAK